MELVQFFLDFVLHLDKHLGEIIKAYGILTYALLFVIVFCETGFVVTPFLPGDSLLFAAGTFCAVGALDLLWVIVLLAFAAIAGDTVNYWIGHFVGPKVFNRQSSRFFKQEHLARTHAFYERYGGKTIVIARFVPIIRTFAPFVAGIGAMTYWKFFAYNVAGGLAWVIILTLAGYFFADLPLVKNNFSLVMLAIIVISVLPGVFEFLRTRHRRVPPAGHGGSE